MKRIIINNLVDATRWNLLSTDDLRDIKIVVNQLLNQAITQEARLAMNVRRYKENTTS